MILRAIIENKEDSCHYRIRIPVLNKSQDAVSATAYEDLYVATVCTLPGLTINYASGDIVFVGFEKDQNYLPVILGQLQRDLETESVTDIKTDSITCNVDFNAQGDFNLEGKAQTDFNAMVEKINETL